MLSLYIFQTCYRQCVADHTITTTANPVTAEAPNFTQVPQNTTQQPQETQEPQGGNESSQLLDEIPCQKPLSYVPSKVLITLWHVVYWTSQFLTWYVMLLCTPANEVCTAE